METTSQLFSSSVDESISQSLATNKPLFVFACNKSNINLLDTFLGGDFDRSETLNSRIHHTFICIRIVQGTENFDHFEATFKSIDIPSIVILQKSKILFQVSLKGSPQTFMDEIDNVIKKVNQNDKSTTKINTNNNNNNNNNNIQSSRSSGRIRGFGSEFKKETERIRKQIQYDQKERKSRQDYYASLGSTNEIKKTDKFATSNVSINTSEMCTILIKLFDGSSLKHTFNSCDTLQDVREWLDIETNNDIIKDTSEYVPSFVESPHPDANNYVFYSYMIGSGNFTDEEETLTLEELNLTPRSVLILKPIYQEPDPSQKPDGMITSIFKTVGKVGASLFSLFDYGSDQIGLEDLNATFDDLTLEQKSSIPTFQHGVTRISSSGMSSEKKGEDRSVEENARESNPCESNEIEVDHLNRDSAIVGIPSRCVTPSITSIGIINSQEEMDK